MTGCNECKKLLSRRAFLRKSAAGAGAVAVGDGLLGSVAATYAQSAGGTGNLLVLCELAGGLDSLSFLAPFRNSRYTSKRPDLALTADEVVPLHNNDAYGINRQFQFLSDLYAQGQLAIVQQCAYPNGNGSHFESQEIYRYGVRNLSGGAGTNASWFERLRKMYFDEPFGVLDTAQVGDPSRYGYPDNTYRGAAQDAFARLAALKTGSTPIKQGILDTYRRINERGADLRTRTESFQSTGAARGEFYRAAQYASADLGTQIVKVRYDGFDTHGSQREMNADLFPRVNNEFQQFVADLQNMGVWERTCVVFYSEFGRRNEQNGSPGTDHGHGGHMFLAGPRVNGGLHGQNVSSADIAADSLPYYVDFRAVFSSAIRDWLGFDPRPIFQFEGETYDEQIGSSLFR
ncbi:MAG TPA: DUF1501 domain-containing protein [Phycisphaerae bacterium]|nr:DUF1501 domain-containing protein [Phycisphaerae bacterium]